MLKPTCENTLVWGQWFDVCKCNRPGTTQSAEHSSCMRGVLDTSPGPVAYFSSPIRLTTENLENKKQELGTNDPSYIV